jgi:16S rRNA (cytidine1402-2'-O)-methyltransferase
MQTALYLIPVTVGETGHDKVLPPYNREIIREIKHFIVENIRSARRFLKQSDPSININELTFYELNKHTPPEILDSYLTPLAANQSVGLISEAGCPAVADPGADITSLAQKKNYIIRPLIGPSSILLALMASGFNGQCFAFNGYLPVNDQERISSIKRLENKAYLEDQTQIFIETPYRNNKLAQDLLQSCRPSSRLCIAANITCDDEFIRTKTIMEWKSSLPDLNKKPTIFLLYK